MGLGARWVTTSDGLRDGPLAEATSAPSCPLHVTGDRPTVTACDRLRPTKKKKTIHGPFISAESANGPVPATAPPDARVEIGAISQRDCTVLICGESGSGKEHVARQIHAASSRATGPFVAVDCTTLRDTLFESQLFGHVRGAFTGADQATIGLFRAAEGGTLLLDEVGELPFALQAKLLRCIQDRAVTPVGGTEPIPADVRLIAATHRDLRAMVEKGEFRADLFFRINVVRLTVPPLRERPDDILRLARDFLASYAVRHGGAGKTLSDCAQRVLREYAWPGNVRELHNALEHALVFSAGLEIAACELPESIRGRRGAAHEPHTAPILTLAEGERRLIIRAMRAAHGNRTLAAQMLGIERHRLARLLRRHQLLRAVPTENSN